MIHQTVLFWPTSKLLIAVVSKRRWNRNAAANHGMTQWLFCARATARCASKTLFAAAMSADKPIWSKVVRAGRKPTAIIEIVNSFFDGKGGMSCSKIKSSAKTWKMPAEYKELLERVLTIQADCEIGGPHLYVKDILPTAPSQVNQLIVARTAAEEMDHYRKIAKLAGDIGTDTSFPLSIPNQKRSLEAFRGVIKTWEDFCRLRLSDRSGRSLSTGGISRLQLFTAATDITGDPERGI